MTKPRSRVKFLAVNDVVRPLADGSADSEGAFAHARRVRQAASLEEAIRLMIGIEAALVVVDETGREIGFLTKDDLLRAIAPPSNNVW